MNHETIVRAWEDPQFRAGLTPELLASLPPNPSGPSMYELNDIELRDMIGAGPMKCWEGGPATNQNNSFNGTVCAPICNFTFAGLCLA